MCRGTSTITRQYMRRSPVRLRCHRPAGHLPGACFLISGATGIETTQVVLHTGLSSYEDDEIDSGHPVSEEEYLVTEDAARIINLAREQQRRVIAVGTTVVRALESAVDGEGRVMARHDFTRLKITPDYQLKVSDGLLTGLHESGASHLEMLSAFVSPALIGVAYKEAIERRYLWHEFGDLSLIV